MANEKLVSPQIDLSELEEVTSKTEEKEDLGAALQRDYVEAFLGSVLAVLMLTAMYILPGLVLIVLPAEIYLVDRIYGILRGAREDHSQRYRTHGNGSVTRAPVYRPAAK